MVRRKYIRYRWALLAILVGAGLTSGCNEDLHLSVVGADVGPDPAEPGDLVQLSVTINILPLQRHAILIYIDDQEHYSESSATAPAEPAIFDLGDASALIEQYGVGEHELHVEVELTESGHRAVSSPVIFELAEVGEGG